MLAREAGRAKEEAGREKRASEVTGEEEKVEEEEVDEAGEGSTDALVVVPGAVLGRTLEE
jgi:hypothetical protein